jgi:hypothetical protein
MTAEDAPEMRLYSPCLCKGSQALVHEECLNMWRQTSAEAYRACSVCKHEYIVDRSALADWTSSELVCTVVSVLATGLLVLLTGLVIVRCGKAVGLDIPRRLLAAVEHDVRNRDCKYVTREYKKHRTEFKVFFDHFYEDSLENFVRDACAGGAGAGRTLKECAIAGIFTPASVSHNPSSFIEFVFKLSKHRPAQLLDATSEYAMHWLVRFGLSVFDFYDQLSVAATCSKPIMLILDSLLLGIVCIGIAGFLGGGLMMWYRRWRDNELGGAVFQELIATGAPLIVVFTMSGSGLAGGGFNYRGIFVLSQIIKGVGTVYSSFAEYVLRRGKEFALSCGERIRPISGRPR